MYCEPCILFGYSLPTCYARVPQFQLYVMAQHMNQALNHFSIYICAPMLQRGHLKTDRAHQQPLMLKGSYAQTFQNFHHQSVFLTIFRTFLNRLMLVSGLVWREEYPERSEQTNRKHGARTESLGPFKVYEYYIYIYRWTRQESTHIHDRTECE